MRGTLQFRQSAGPIPSKAVQWDDEPEIQADAPSRLPKDAGSVLQSFPRCHIAEKQNDEKSPEIYDDSIPPTSGIQIS